LGESGEVGRGGERRAESVPGGGELAASLRLKALLKV
jgi:hypothetical protein